jgi:hypothetical protein
LTRDLRLGPLARTGAFAFDGANSSLRSAARRRGRSWRARSKATACGYDPINHFLEIVDLRTV